MALQIGMWRNRIGSKIALIVGLACVLMFGAFAISAYLTGTKMLQRQSEAKANAVAGFGKAIVEHLMVEKKRKRITDVLRTAITFSEIKDAMIFKPDGQIAWDDGDADSASHARISEFVKDPTRNGDRFLSTKIGGKPTTYVISQIENGKACSECHSSSGPILGYFAVRVATDDLQDIATQHRTLNVILLGISIVGLGGVILTALTLLIVRPVRKLHSQMTKAKQAIDSTKAGAPVVLPSLRDPKGNDEIADVHRTFNELVCRLAEVDRQLVEMHHKQLERADRVASAGEMAASLAHEIKNPLAGVLGALQVLEAEITEEDSRKELLREMMSQLERINHAVNDLLSYARPAPPVFSSVNTTEVIQKVVLLLQQQLRGSTIRITTELQAKDGEIHADKKMLQQLFWNVALNGVQAMGESGTLTIRTAENETSLMVEIIDTGLGIAQENLQNVFTPFFSTKHKGSGLGLAISKRIVEQHGGNISLASTLGKGTTVTVTLPLKQQFA